jgi:cell division protein FtsB
MAEQENDRQQLASRIKYLEASNQKLEHQVKELDESFQLMKRDHVLQYESLVEAIHHIQQLEADIIEMKKSQSKIVMVH